MIDSDGSVDGSEKIRVMTLIHDGTGSIMASTEEKMDLSLEKMAEIYSLTTGKEENRIIGQMVNARNKLWSWIVVGVGLITVTLIEGVILLNMDGRVRKYT
ncbi:hypothetical protein KR100_08815 [Synechococcus sp. KORDI-100]|nr:hypothetical protein KR100_08815 [Synechococcus sp. KORDI-100]